MPTTCPATPEECEYYPRVHGFDPRACFTEIDSNRYCYEASFPLEHDPALIQAGVTIAARVEVFRQRGEGQNRIVLRQCTRERRIECVHTVLYQGALDSLGPLPGSNTPAKLPPLEHFAALRSFVSGIAEVGIGSLLQGLVTSWEGGEDLPAIGFAGLHFQILAQLLDLTPDAMPLARNFVLGILRSAPPRWLLERWAILECS